MKWLWHKLTQCSASTSASSPLFGPCDDLALQLCSVLVILQVIRTKLGLELWGGIGLKHLKASVLNGEILYIETLSNTNWHAAFAVPLCLNCNQLVFVCKSLYMSLKVLWEVLCTNKTVDLSNLVALNRAWSIQDVPPTIAWSKRDHINEEIPKNCQICDSITWVMDKISG